jgi:hypothetical protein
LLDYVGWDVAIHLLKVMQQQLPDPAFQSSFLEAYHSQGVRGGQTADGQQKDGLFHYEEGRPTAIYDLKSRSYRPLMPLQLGSVPLGLSWKRAVKEKTDLSPYFKALESDNSEGAQMAVQFLAASKAIEELLVTTGVAASLNDVGVVIKEGFHHLYAPHEVI